MTKTTREAKSRLEKFYDERVISFGGKGKKFWVKLYEKDLEHLLEKEREGYLTSKGNAEMSRDARARLGLTQIEMAKRLGISTIQLAKVEGGDRGFSKKVLIKLSILKGKK